jgi:cobyric acid synthase
MGSPHRGAISHRLERSRCCVRREWPIVREALHSLMCDYEQGVIEGGGSPAEINLHASDSSRQTSLPLLLSALER